MRQGRAPSLDINDSSSPELGDEGMRHLAAFTGLSSLGIVDNHLEADGMRNLAALPA